MKTRLKLTVLLTIVLCTSATFIQAQSTTKPAYHQADFIADNPTADRDLQTVTEYLNALLVAGDLKKARGFLTADFKMTGPSAKDSATADGYMNVWKENYKSQKDRKAEFVLQSFRSLQGDLAGNWVCCWGTYTCMISGQFIKIPFQTTLHLTDAGVINNAVLYFDNISVMQSLGFIITPPPAPKK